MRHIDLTAHFQIFRGIFQSLWNALDGLDIGCHIFTHHAVAAGGSTHKYAVLIFQAAGKAVDLDLDDIFRLDPGFPYPAVKIAQFIEGKRIQKAFHLHSMCHLCKAPAGGAAHFLGRRIRSDQLREFCFQCFQLPGQSVIFKILQLRGILIIV